MNSIKIVNLMKINDDFNKKRTIINLYICKNKNKFDWVLSDTHPPQPHLCKKKLIILIKINIQKI